MGHKNAYKFTLTYYVNSLLNLRGIGTPPVRRRTWTPALASGSFAMGDNGDKTSRTYDSAGNMVKGQSKDTGGPFKGIKP